MPVDTSGADVALGNLSNLPVGQLIAAPLKAAIEAQAIAADTTIKFIKEVGFSEDPLTGALEITTVTFSYQGPSGEKSILTVPILAIVPIPYLEIQTVDIDFKAKITASGSSSESRTASQTASGTASASASFRGGAFRANLAMSGSVSSKKDSTSTRDSKYSVEYCYDIRVHAAQPGLPAGLSKVLSILGDLVTPVPAGQLRLNVDPGSVSVIGAPTTTDVTVSIVSADGSPASGIEIKATSSDETVLTITSATKTTAAEGKATFTVNAIKPGSASVTFGVTKGPLPQPATRDVVVSAT